MIHDYIFTSVLSRNKFNIMVQVQIKSYLGTPSKIITEPQLAALGDFTAHGIKGEKCEP